MAEIRIPHFVAADGRCAFLSSTVSRWNEMAGRGSDCVSSLLVRTVHAGGREIFVQGVANRPDECGAIAGDAHFGIASDWIAVVQPGADAGVHGFVRAAIARAGPAVFWARSDCVRDGSGVLLAGGALLLRGVRAGKFDEGRSTIAGNHNAGARRGVEGAKGATESAFFV